MGWGVRVGNQFDCTGCNPLYLAAKRRSHAEARRSQWGLKNMPIDLNEITGSIIETSIEIHRQLGPGLLESVYLKWTPETGRPDKV